MQPEAVPRAGNDPLSTFLVQQAQQELQIQPSKTDVSSTQAGGGLLVTLLAQQQEQQQQSTQAVASGPQAGGDLLATLLAQQQQSQPGALAAQTGGDLMVGFVGSAAAETERRSSTWRGCDGRSTGSTGNYYRFCC